MNSASQGRGKCGYCEEEIPMGARRCPYCGSLVEAEPAQNNIHEDPLSEATNRGVWSDSRESDKSEGLAVEKIAGTSEGEQVGVNLAKDQVDSKTYLQSENYGQSQVQGTPYTGGRILDAKQNGKLGNGLKVFLTTISNVVPGIGQLVGIIMAIVYMNSEEDDRRSFGLALLTSSIIVFFIMLFIGCALMMAYMPGMEY